MRANSAPFCFILTVSLHVRPVTVESLPRLLARVSGHRARRLTIKTRDVHQVPEK